LPPGIRLPVKFEASPIGAALGASHASSSSSGVHRVDRSESDKDEPPDPSTMKIATGTPMQTKGQY